MKFFKTQKGQSALEYLMTYGWALVVMVIVVAALVALDVFNLGSTTTTCAGFPTLIAYQRHTLGADGNFQFAFLNGTGEEIEVTDGTLGGEALTFTDINVNPGDTGIISASAGPTGTAGRSYKHTLAITYNVNTETPFVGVKATGTCLGKYQ